MSTNDDAHRLRQRALDHQIEQQEKRARHPAAGWYHPHACPLCGGTVFEAENHSAHCVEDGCPFEEPA